MPLFTSPPLFWGLLLISNLKQKYEYTEFTQNEILFDDHILTLPFYTICLWISHKKSLALKIFIFAKIQFPDL